VTTATAINLKNLDSDTFEHLVNCLAIRVLGYGVLSFARGPDAGRDGYFYGECEYPSRADKWSGTWYIQSKYCDNPSGSNGQKWLLNQIKNELKLFADHDSGRKWPDNWILATNVNPSAVAESGTFDKARKIAEKYNSKLASHFHIWGEKTLSTHLVNNPSVLESFRHLLTPGYIVAYLIRELNVKEKRERTLLHYLLAGQIVDQQYTKLEQAGSDSDTRPGVHDLFIDIPFVPDGAETENKLLKTICMASAGIHMPVHSIKEARCWVDWKKRPERARLFFIRGGPGQGKSTVGQYFAQIHRAAMIIKSGVAFNSSVAKKTAGEIEKAAKQLCVWPLRPRIPIIVELKEYAQWLSEKKEFEAQGILAFLVELLSARAQTLIDTDLLRTVLSKYSWFVAFDGLDEVPSDAKDFVAREVKRFVTQTWEEIGFDLLAVCTSRPQGYSGQFNDIEGPTVDLIYLKPSLALQCAEPLLKINRNPEEFRDSVETLKTALESDAVRQLMRTPLQAHIMAVVIRDGGRPPERRWQLFARFYEVIRRREARNKIADKKTVKLLQNETVLVKRVHNVLGFILHKRAERSKGSETFITRTSFRKLAEYLVVSAVDTEADATVEILMRATVDRLVLVNTPDNGDKLRFDVRQLQEFFAAEYCYEDVATDDVKARLEVIAGDAHWREVTYFTISAVIENHRKSEQLVAAKVLEQLNENYGIGQLPHLSRAMARGAYLALRLLQEGVLEQDKGMRGLFAEALRPLIQVQDEQLLVLACSVTGANSKSWLISFLLQGFDDARDDRRGGAACLLALLTNDGDSHLAEVERRLTGMPSNAIAWISKKHFEIMEQHRWKHHEVLPKWLFSIVINIMRSEHWGDSIVLLHSIYRVLWSNGGPRRNSPHLHALSKPEQLIVKDALARLAGSTRKTIGQFSYTKCESYKLGEPISFSKSDLEAVSGIFKFWGLLLYGASSDNFHAISRALNMVSIDAVVAASGGHTRVSQCLPIWSNIIDTKTQITKAKASNAATFIDFLKENNEVMSSRNFTTEIPSAPGSSDEIMALIKDDAEIATYSIAVNLGTAVDTQLFLSLLDEKVITELAKKAAEMPRMAAHFPSLWGLFCKGINPALKQKFITSLVSHFERDDDNIWVWSRYYMPFPIKLPEEVVLLRPLFSAIVSAVPDQTTGRKGRIEDEMRHRFDETFINREACRAIMVDKNRDAITRVAALLVLATAIENSGSIALAEHVDLFVAAFLQRYGLEFADAVMQWVGLFRQSSDNDAQLLLDKLLAKTLGDYEIRDKVEQVLSRWREISSAPVTQITSEEPFGAAAKFSNL
jgi:hypothetical protein